MLRTLKSAVKRSPLHSIARSLYEAWLPAEQRTLCRKNQAYDRQTVAVMERVVKPGSCCVDVGAHEGAVLQHMVRLAPYGHHYAFEPLPDFAARLRACFHTVDVVECAVSHIAGESTFVHVVDAPGYSGLRERIYDRPNPQRETITVKVVRIDDVVDRPVDFIKIDIEGGEYHAMLGAQRLFAVHRPVVVFEAGKQAAPSYGVSALDLYGLFTSFGYHVSTMGRWLDQRQPYTEAEFAQTWHEGSEFYFIGYPS